MISYVSIIMKKILSLLFVILTVFVNTSVIFATGVETFFLNTPNGNLAVDVNGTHFVFADGTMAMNKWVKVLDRFMYFDSNGNQAIYSNAKSEIVLGTDGLSFAHKAYVGNISEPTSTIDGSMLAEQLAARTLDNQPTSRSRLISKLRDSVFVFKETGREKIYTLEEAEKAVDEKIKVDWNYAAFMSGVLYYLENEVQPNRDSLQGGDVYEYLLGQGFTRKQADKASDMVIESIYKVEKTGLDRSSYGTNQNDNYFNGLLN